MTSTSPTALRVDGLSVRFGEKSVLQHVSLEAEAGEFLALTGPNGSGKTTLLRAILDLVPTSAGRIDVFGRPTRSLAIRERARLVAWVPQDESPRDNVRLLEYVLYGRYPHLAPFRGESADDRGRATSALAAVGLADRAAAGVLELSGGERQRLLLGRALAQGAPILLLDEPTAHLDIGFQLDLLERVRRLVRERGVLAVAALHDLNLAARYADRVLVLSKGRCVAEGPPARVLDPPLLRSVWGVEADLRRDPRTGQPYLLPHRTVSAAERQLAATGTLGPVHVVGGGGAAAPVMRRLVEEGYAVTVGAVPLLDTDCETAEELGVPAAVEVPFAPLGPEVRARHRELLGAARAVVVAPFAVGPSNLGNLEDLIARDAGAPTFLLGADAFAQRDFTDGAAAKLYAEIRARGARPVRDLDELLRGLREGLSRPS